MTTILKYAGGGADSPEIYRAITGMFSTPLSHQECSFVKEGRVWKQFKVYELFEKLNLKNKNKLFCKIQDTSVTRTDEFNLPLVNAKLGNNGIMFYGRERDFDSSEMTISVVSNGAVATGMVYAQPNKTGILWDAYLLKANIADINKRKLLFLASILQKSIRNKYGWENKAVWSKVQNEYIFLPVINNFDIDCDYMESLISGIEKIIIKDVVKWTDKKIATTKKVVMRDTFKV
ncbi:restriction endonuclease [Salmonella enterica]|nr:restriction endonuclease [Salmonella enterica]